MRRFVVTALLLVVSMMAGVQSSAGQATSTQGGSVRSDFNGDGFSDLAVGVPFDDVGAATDAGVVNVIYGSAAGLAPAGNQVWSQNNPGIGDTAESGDQLGYSMASGDFNGDGFADLAIGVPFDDIGAAADAGVVNVIYGSAAGLGAAGSQVWSQNNPGIGDVAETGDTFGISVASGDFNGDGFADLASGTPGEDLAALADAGAANVIYGSASGLAAAGNQLWTQDSADIEDVAEVGDGFGTWVDAGDYGGGAFADLAAGVAFEDVGAVADAGGVNAIYGSAGGLASAGDQIWTQNSPGIGDTAEASDFFGFTSASGDFNGDGFVDLAIGSILEDLGPATDAGSMNVLYGSAAGLASAGNQVWNQNSPGIGDTPEAGDQFGAYPGTGDFNGDGFVDLGVGALGEDVGALADAGGLNAIYGSGAGLTAAGNQVWTQDSAGILDTAEVGDNFGCWLTTGDFDADGFADAAICVQFEDVAAVDMGAENVIYGTAAGLAGAGNQLWHQDRPGIGDVGEVGDAFGWSTA